MELQREREAGATSELNTLLQETRKDKEKVEEKVVSLQEQLALSQREVARYKDQLQQLQDENMVLVFTSKCHVCFIYSYICLFFAYSELTNLLISAGTLDFHMFSYLSDFWHITPNFSSTFFNIPLFCPQIDYDWEVKIQISHLCSMIVSCILCDKVHSDWL